MLPHAAICRLPAASRLDLLKRLYSLFSPTASLDFFLFDLAFVEDSADFFDDARLAVFLPAPSALVLRGEDDFDDERDFFGASI